MQLYCPATAVSVELELPTGALAKGVWAGAEVSVGLEVVV